MDLLSLENLGGFLIFALILGIGIVMIMIERAAPGRNWPKVRGWWPRAICLNVFQAGAVWLLGVAWNGWLLEHRILHAERLGIIAGTLFGYFIMTFVYYWWHRWRHEAPMLWRWMHQLHHSPQRLEVITSFYKHPFEIVANAALSSTVAMLVLGLSPAAAACVMLVSGVAELFYHWNVRTPYWLGFLFQRPESHCVHHQTGLHSFNYSDLPLWDLLFGTFYNPKASEFECGFGAAELRLPEMLAGIDINDTEAGAAIWIPKRAIVLLLLGLMQMTGSVLGLDALKAIGLAIGASPAPKVFCSVRGLETFSSSFVIEWRDRSGHRHAEDLTPALYANLRGPYNRRNVYGAVLAYGPVLQSDPRTRKAYDSVVQYALCGSAPLLHEIGIEDIASGSAEVRMIPRLGTPFGDEPYLISARCNTR
jgi:sterol desaturase/sphingolipid hydroxylase (fatty acid hydroxylase superfamily)